MNITEKSELNNTLKNVLKKSANLNTSRKKRLK
jgi:hypothetical protein